MESKVIDFFEAKQKLLVKKEQEESSELNERHVVMRDLTNILKDIGLNDKDAEQLYKDLIIYEAKDLPFDISKFSEGDKPW